MMAKNLSVIFVVAIALMAMVVMWSEPVDGQACLDAWEACNPKKPQRCCGYHCIPDPREKYPTGDLTIWWVCDYPGIHTTTEPPVATSPPSASLWDKIRVLANATRDAVNRCAGNENGCNN